MGICHTLIIFISIFILYGAVVNGASIRENYFKFHNNLMDEEKALNKPLYSTPTIPLSSYLLSGSSEKQPLPSITETFEWPISSRKILSQRSSLDSVPDGSQCGTSCMVVITSLSITLIVVIVLGVCFICCKTKRPRAVTDPGIGFTKFTHDQLRKATNGFSNANRLGAGGFGEVFKGILPDKKVIAVKRLTKEPSQAHRNFLTEVKAISRAFHKHTVSLIGYCIDADRRFIVLECVLNNSLHHYLHGGDQVQVLDWATRMKIAIGSAKGLEYLHDDCPQTIIHRDIKPANILLDKKFEPKVADFGIAKLCPESFDIYIKTNVGGTIGYIDPDYFGTSKLTVKSDVYSFGVVLLELLSGCRPPEVHDLVEKLPTALKKSKFDTLADRKLQNNYDTGGMALMVACADACLCRESKDRPSMKLVAQVLEGIISPNELKEKNKA